MPTGAESDGLPPRIGSRIHCQKRVSMIELAKILGLGAAAAIFLLLVAPPGLVYLAAFIALVPILGLSLWLTFGALGGRLHVPRAIVQGATQIIDEPAPRRPILSADGGETAPERLTVEQREQAPPPLGR